MPDTALTRAWMALLLLCFAATLISVVVPHGIAPVPVAATILLIAWLKSRVILSRYLGLFRAPAWQAGFLWVLGIFCLLLFGLYLIPAIAGS